MAFIHELFARGITKSALYFYYYGLVIDQAGYTKKYETVVLASELRDAILEGIPRYGLRPRVSAVLFAMERGDTDNRLIPYHLLLPLSVRGTEVFFCRPDLRAAML